jgi:hypothetical protein
MPHPVMVPKPRARMITREKSTGESAYLWAMVNSQVLKKEGPRCDPFAAVRKEECGRIMALIMDCSLAGQVVCL